MNAVTTGLAAGVWQFRSTLSSAGFDVRHMGGTGTVHGQVPIREGWVRADRDGRPVAAGAVLDLAGLDTGNVRRDADLRKPRLLDTATYPTLTFDATDFAVDGDAWAVTGVLAGHGHRTGLTLAATLTPADGGTLAVHATAEFDRRELGVTAPRLLVGTRVRITLDAVFTAPQ